MNLPTSHDRIERIAKFRYNETSSLIYDNHWWCDRLTSNFTLFYKLVLLWDKYQTAGINTTIQKGKGWASGHLNNGESTSENSTKSHRASRSEHDWRS